MANDTDTTELPTPAQNVPGASLALHPGPEPHGSRRAERAVYVQLGEDAAPAAASAPVSAPAAAPGGAQAASGAHASAPAAPHASAAQPAARSSLLPHHSMWKHLGLHVLVPLFLGIGMALAYLGAFHQPAPHNLPVAIVGEGPAAQVFAETMNDQAPGALEVRTVGTPAAAKKAVRDRDIAGAFYVHGDTATLYLATAASATTAETVQKIFQPIAFQQHLLYQVEDVVPVGEHDATGQGLFFLLVGLSVGGYAFASAAAVVIGRHGILARVFVPVIGSALVSGIVITIATAVYHVFDTHVVGVWLVSWLYDAIIMWIGAALMPIFKGWTVAIMTMLFVMLNFTSSGGIFQKTMEPGFFGALNSFWAGAGWLNSATALVYFPGQSFARDGLVLGVWAGLALVAVLVTHLVVKHHERVAAAKAVAGHMAGAAAH